MHGVVYADNSLNIFPNLWFIITLLIPLIEETSFLQLFLSFNPPLILLSNFFHVLFLSLSLLFSLSLSLENAVYTE